MDDTIILFDLDGTLTDSGEGITKSVAYAIEKMGFPALPQSTLLKFIGPPLTESYPDRCGMNREETDRAIAYFHERFDTVGIWENYPIPGMRELLGDSEYGLITEDSVEGLYRGMKQMLENPGLREEYARKAALRGKAFSKEKLVKQTEQFFEELLR